MMSARLTGDCWEKNMLRTYSLIGVALFAVSASVALFAFRGKRAVANGTRDSVNPSHWTAGRASNVAYEARPLAFEPNVGQIDSRVRFVSHGTNYSFLLTADEVLFSLRSPESSVKKGLPKVSGEPRHSSRKITRIRMSLAGANPQPEVQGLDELPGKVNYLIGNDRSKWKRNIATYAKVKYHNVYPGVDVVYYGNQHQLEYDFIVAPGADASKIRFFVPGSPGLAGRTHNG